MLDTSIINIRDVATISNLRIKEGILHIKKLYYFGRTPDVLPSGLLSLATSDDYNKILFLPRTIKKIKLGYSFNSKIYTKGHFMNTFLVLDDTIPLFELTALRTVILGYNFNRQDILNALPDSIVNLTIGNGYNGQVIVLPENLEKLTLGDSFNNNSIFSALIGTKKLKELTFGWHFNQSITYLPASLRYLKVGGCFAQKLDPTVIKSLKCLVLGHFYNFKCTVNGAEVVPGHCYYDNYDLSNYQIVKT